MQQNRLPNLFIVGFPKTGTTTLFDTLAQHPDIFPSKRKEPGDWENLHHLNKANNFSDIRKWDLPDEFLRSLAEGVLEEAVRHKRDDIAECLRIALKRSKSTPIKIGRYFKNLGCN